MIIALPACSKKTINDTDKPCTQNCTIVQGRFVTANNLPVPNVNIQGQYNVPGSSVFGGGSTRLLVSTKSDQNGNYNQSFFIKDTESGVNAKGTFIFTIDDSELDVNKYIRTNNLVGNSTTSLGFSVYRIHNRDTVIRKNFYIPTKTYIRVSLNNFTPVQTGDYFEVRTHYPYGEETNITTPFNTGYGTGSSGPGTFKAQSVNNTLQVFAAGDEQNIIQILRRKNGVNTIEEHPFYIPVNNTIDLTFSY